MLVTKPIGTPSVNTRRSAHWFRFLPQVMMSYSQLLPNKNNIIVIGRLIFRADLIIPFLASSVHSALFVIKFTLGLSTNHLPTQHQPNSLMYSPNSVNANSQKELQNVLPKCNPFPIHIEYILYSCRDEACLNRCFCRAP